MSAGSCAVMLLPLNSMLPLRGSMMPLMVLRMVVLPAPLEPSTVAISLRRTCRLTPRIALMGP
ncbi:hypothetical protein Y695_02467 [Hydrogenophaga sp. T4]|nr:hypothetical protein Y695_02467 [Hydrogenophaga sp. T4]